MLNKNNKIEVLKEVVSKGGKVDITPHIRPNSSRVNYDPRLFLPSFKQEVAKKLYNLLKEFNISCTLKKQGTKYRIMITGIWNIYNLFSLADIKFKDPKNKIFYSFIKLRVKKLKLNKKARYGNEEKDLNRKFQQLKKQTHRDIHLAEKILKS